MLPILNRLGRAKQKIMSGQAVSLQDFFAREEAGPSAFRGGIGPGQDPEGRYREAALRGGAPFTAEGLATAARNALGIMGGVSTIKTGVSSMLNETGLKPQGFFGDAVDAVLGPGVQDIPGHYAIQPEARKRITDFESYQAELHAAEKAAEARKADALAKALDRASQERKARDKASHGGRGGPSRSGEGRGGVSGGYGGGVGGTARGPK